MVYGRWVQLQMLIPCSSQYMQRNAATACPSRMFSNASFDAPVAVASTGLTYVGFLGGGGVGRRVWSWVQLQLSHHKAITSHHAMCGLF